MIWELVGVPCQLGGVVTTFVSISVVSGSVLLWCCFFCVFVSFFVWFLVCFQWFVVWVGFCAWFGWLSSLVLVGFCVSFGFLCGWVWFISLFFPSGLGFCLSGLVVFWCVRLVQWLVPASVSQWFRVRVFCGVVLFFCGFVLLFVWFLVCCLGWFCFCVSFGWFLSLVVVGFCLVSMVSVVSVVVRSGLWLFWPLFLVWFGLVLCVGLSGPVVFVFGLVFFADLLVGSLEMMRVWVW